MIGSVSAHAGIRKRDSGDYQTFAELWRMRVQMSAEAPFLVFEDELDDVYSWSYGEFDAAVTKIVVTLQGFGVVPGSAVHVALRNCPAFVCLWLACAQLGALLVPVDPESGERELDVQLSRIPARVGVCGATRATRYRAASSRHDIEVIELSESALDLQDARLIGEAGPTAPPAIDARIGASDRLAVMFTSGTTSQPKGVVVSQGNYVNVAERMAKAARLAEHDRWLVTLPLFHANAQYYCFAPAIAVGASVALTWRFSASGWIGSANRMEATHASLFAAPIRMILARHTTDERAHLRHVWYAQSLGSNHYREFTDLAGVAPRQLYGMTETIAIVTADTSAEPQSDIIGTPYDGRTVRLIDRETGAEVPPGRPGEITVAGVRGVDLFVEYLDDRETTEASFHEIDGVTWFSTGDLAVVDETGVMRFVGRVDDVIKVSGENVSLTEVEAAIAEAPGVLEAAVISRPDLVRDHVPIAFVVPRDPSHPPVLDELVSWAERALTRAARPAAWHIVPGLPRTSVGKLKRSELTQEVDLFSD